MEIFIPFLIICGWLKQKWRSISQFVPILPRIDITYEITSVMQSYTIAEVCNPQATIFINDV
ncbi:MULTISPECIES: hypothetical protein [unclassified Microcoleus]|jgi:hypothetical protein|uniref:hypothetical protein n=1 Tax=unclassified Microcoleus TaxID=2642155 RepID=UPI001E0D2BB3|nr:MULTISPECIES: hypothetical protein [unclassified Microcoleus]MCC3445828.1 hypothetical protein [Microcoleus sp. PH2017_03_ELD_O_A]MCC3451748.1 hypothetical protein [Microcoleus sp. PH2017_09_SFU_O_A]MCC3466054.1 hypothetical protein [Microcoleus sp. PH2017_06_SFM_O_A]MCC3507501.1 hypothetical protein [Microcoleus sp. PH2017_19_SFW_U_A]MCC3510028.1 hypothetical protein [Microcoleus sp. PH2017_17_BER_D_A]MCC3583651.1 hypothetical protein [Microcoleus sp. PH2017_30_WIL_O_A]TAE11762.1 MAG: hy